MKLFLLMILPLALTNVCSADIFVNVQQNGPDVVVTSQGSVDLSDFIQTVGINGEGFLRPSPDFGIPAGVITGFPFEYTGSFPLPVEAYVPNSSPIDGPPTFGPNISRTTIATSGSGDNHGFGLPTMSAGSLGLLYVPHGYQSGDFLQAESTYANVTLSELGVDVGSYQWTTENNTFNLVASVVDTVLLGDVNQDGVVDFSDIPAFISILIAGGFQADADINQDEVVDFADIPPFIEILQAS